MHSYSASVSDRWSHNQSSSVGRSSSGPSSSSPPSAPTTSKISSKSPRALCRCAAVHGCPELPETIEDRSTSGTLRLKNPSGPLCLERGDARTHPICQRRSIVRRPVRRPCSRPRMYPRRPWRRTRDMVGRRRLPRAPRAPDAAARAADALLHQSPRAFSSSSPTASTCAAARFAYASRGYVIHIISLNRGHQLRMLAAIRSEQCAEWSRATPHTPAPAPAATRPLLRHFHPEHAPVRKQVAARRRQLCHARAVRVHHEDLLYPRRQCPRDGDLRAVG